MRDGERTKTERVAVRRPSAPEGGVRVAVWHLVVLTLVSVGAGLGWGFLLGRSAPPGPVVEVQPPGLVETRPEPSTRPAEVPEPAVVEAVVRVDTELGTTITASHGTVEGDRVTGLGVGDRVAITLVKEGFVPARVVRDVEAAADVWRVALEPVPVVPAPAAVVEEPARPAVARAPARGGPGQVRITAKPWAKVTVDGRPRGTTPVELELPAGRHQVTLTKGGESRVKWVTVKAGATAQVSAEF